MSQFDWDELPTAQLTQELKKRNIHCASRKRKKMIAKLVEHDGKSHAKQLDEAQAKPNRKKRKKKGRRKSNKNELINIDSNKTEITSTFNYNHNDSINYKTGIETNYQSNKSNTNINIETNKQNETNFAESKDNNIDPEIISLLSMQGMFKISKETLLKPNASTIICNTLLHGYDFMKSCETGDISRLKSIKATLCCNDTSDGSNDKKMNILDQFDVNCKCVLFDGNSGLHLACYNGHVECIKYLLFEYKCDIFITNDISNQSILHSCSIADHCDVLSYLLSLRANKGLVCDINDENIRNSWNLDQINDDNHQKSWFWNKIDLYDCHGTTPLQLAFAYANHECIQLLLSYGADIEHKSKTFKSGKDWMRELAQDRIYASVATGLNVFRATLIAILMPDTINFKKKVTNKSKKIYSTHYTHICFSRSFTLLCTDQFSVCLCAFVQLRKVGCTRTTQFASTILTLRSLILNVRLQSKSLIQCFCSQCTQSSRKLIEIL